MQKHPRNTKYLWSICAKQLWTYMYSYNLISVDRVVVPTPRNLSVSGKSVVVCLNVMFLLCGRLHLTKSQGHVHTDFLKLFQNLTQSSPFQSRTHTSSCNWLVLIVAVLYTCSHAVLKNTHQPALTIATVGTRVCLDICTLVLLVHLSPLSGGWANTHG